MATVQISDVIVPPVFTPYVINRTTELSRLHQSGIIVNDPMIAQLAQGPASFFDMPHFDDLGDKEANTGSDDPNEKSVPEKIGTGKDTAQKFFRNQSWSSMDLTSALLAKDPMGVIADLVAGYWSRQGLRTLIASLKGIIAANIAQNDGDMVWSVPFAANGAPLADINLIGANPVLFAKQTMGDAANALTAMVVHSVIHTRLQSQNLISYIPNSQGVVNIPTYLGYELMVDDMCPVEVVNGHPVYTSFLFGRGAVGYGEGSPKKATAVTRDEAAGNGEGQEVLTNRKHFVQHLRGIAFTREVMAGESPTNTELANPANYERKFTRKKIRFVAIRTNG